MSDSPVPNATTMRWEAAPFLYGEGATAEIGFELKRLGISRALIVTDANIAATGLPDRVAGFAHAGGVETVVWAESEIEPTDTSVNTAIDALSGEQFDGYIALGGGSVIDTCKAIALLRADSSHDLVSYVAKPHGEGRTVPQVAPILAIPTTSGSGAEATGAANFHFDSVGHKASIVDRGMTPAFAVIDPLNTVSAPPAVTACAGYDVLVQSLESYTSKPFDQMPALRPDKRSPMVGSNPIGDVCAQRSIELCGKYLVRAVSDGDDIEARTGMTQATMLSRIGVAGAHVPHANGAAVAALAGDSYKPAGFTGVDRPLIPHGYAVMSTAAEALAFTYSGAPERHDHAAELLGGSDLQSALRRIVKATDGPENLAVFGFTEADVPALAERSFAQKRMFPRSPRPVTLEDLEGIFTRSLSEGPDA